MAHTSSLNQFPQITSTTRLSARELITDLLDAMSTAEKAERSLDRVKAALKQYNKLMRELELAYSVTNVLRDRLEKIVRLVPEGSAAESVELIHSGDKWTPADGPSFIELHFELENTDANNRLISHQTLKQYADYIEDRDRDWSDRHGPVITIFLKHKLARR